MITDYFSKKYAHFYKFRERRFGYNLRFNNFPKGFSKQPFIIIMDPMWILSGMYGLNRFYIPDGEKYSARYDETSSLFQSWLGTYFVNMVSKKNLPEETNLAYDFAKAALLDQKFWLLSHGSRNTKVKLLDESIEEVEVVENDGFTQFIFEGLIESGIDDEKQRRKVFDFLYEPNAKIAAEYSDKQAISTLLMNDPQSSVSFEIKLKGYYGVIPVSAKKFIINYFCVPEQNFEEYKNEMMNCLKSFEISPFIQ